MEAEVEWAITQISDNKAPGADEIPIELIKAAGEGITKEITTLCNLIWEKEEWPKEWGKSIFIPIFKKGDARECENYRTIALISHTSKILLKIIHKRMEVQLRESFLIIKQVSGNSEVNGETKRIWAASIYILH